MEVIPQVALKLNGVTYASHLLVFPLLNREHAFRAKFIADYGARLRISANYELLYEILNNMNWEERYAYVARESYNELALRWYYKY
jgi:hypothetical protein